MAMLTKQFSAILTMRVGIALMACLMALVLEWQRPEFIARLDEGFRDSFLRITADQSPESRLVVIDISEASLNDIGPWPWSRQRVADLVEILVASYGARVVGLDIVFPEPGDASGDTRLASLAADAPLNLAQIFDYTPRKLTISEGTLTGGVSPLAGLDSFRAYGFIANHSGLVGARCIGNIGYLPDADGVLRHTPVRTRYEGQDYQHFASSLLNCTNPLASIPVGDEKGLWRVPFTHALSAYTIISAADILRERAPRELVVGRYALVGSSSLGLGDRVSTPLAPLSSGVMVHAASLSGLLDLAEGNAQAPESGRGWLLAWVALSVALAVIGIARLSAWGGLLLLLGLVFSWLTLAFAGVARQVEWSVTAPLWSYFFLLIVAVPHEWWQAQRKNRRLLTVFSHYVAHPVLDEIVRLGLTHSLEPTRREVTVLIADMEGYTRATSSLTLEEAATLTKDFLGCLTRPVLEWRGTLDKYTGDGLVAFWGAPLACPDQADHAVSAALEILVEVGEFNARRQARGVTPVQVRIGIESGRALVGDLGTAFRSTYTAVGDCINFASRLEAAARDLPTQLVIGSAANAKLVQHQTISLGSITLRGTQTTIDVFTVKV